VTKVLKLVQLWFIVLFWVLLKEC